MESSTSSASRNSLRRRLRSEGEISPQACCNGRNFSGPCLNSQTARRSCLLDARSSSAMMGRPVSDPRTRLPGNGVAAFFTVFFAALFVILASVRRRRLRREAAARCLQRQIERVGDIGYGAIEAAQHQYLQDLSLVVMLSQPIEFLFVEGCPEVQGVDGCDQGLLGLAPA